jgi:beta-lactamase regulating signal transducer with metallopeptidase domain
VLCALYWWNPFVYLLKKDINQSLEIRCDQKVTQCLEKDKRAEYLTIILEEFRNSVGVKSNQNEYMMEMAGHEDDALVERFQLVANGGYCTFLWKRIVIAVSFFMIFIASYSFVIQSSFDLPASEIEDGTYLYDESNSYILHHHDGTYHLVTPYETLKLNEDQVQFYLNEGFALKEQ